MMEAAGSGVRRTGFTLMELLVVVIVIAILAAVAIPNYRRSIERGYWRQANDLLLTIYHGERAYFLTNNKYHGPLDASKSMDEWRKIHMDNPNTGGIPVDFRVTAAAAPPGFKATAKRVGGPCDNKTQTIDEQRQPGAGDTWTNPDVC
jgi:prepilin-type N-terminal cleavage/methylation domain-containing protein